MKYTLKKYLVCLLAAVLSFFVFPHAVQNEVGKEVVLPTANDSAMCSATVLGEDVRISSRLWELLFGKEDGKSDTGTVLLLPGGTVFGARIKQSHVSVSDPGEVKELRAGDKILSVDGKNVSSASELKNAISKCEGKDISLICKRGDKQITVKLKPQMNGDGYNLGITLKDGAAGIGTITYIDPGTGEFGGLGHGICDPDTGEPIDMLSGQVTGVVLGGVKRGEAGKPGELSGILTDHTVGTLYANTECGIFGKLDKIPENLDTLPIEIAKRSEVHEGEATIYSTIKNGKAHEFKVQICDINPTSTTTKSFKIKATDPTLTALTGGVVRGMSGSPIIQDGKLVGAVTHVMVANPTEGYGIFIENMLNASSSARNELPAA